MRGNGVGGDNPALRRHKSILTALTKEPDVLAAPVSIAMPRDAERLADFINAWLRLKREVQTLDKLYRYWTLGGGAEPTQPRWSVIRDVLGWVD